MTSVMFSPLDKMMWPLRSLKQGIEKAAGQGRVPEEAKGFLDSYKQSIYRGGLDFFKAVQQEIAMREGHTFPFAVGVDTLDKYDKMTIKTLAGGLEAARDDLARIFRKYVASDNSVSHEDAAKMTGFFPAIETSIKILHKAIDERYTLKFEAAEVNSLFNYAKNAANDPENDRQGGPFGNLVVMGKGEATSFLEILKYMGQDNEDWDVRQKMAEIMTLVYDTASSKWGELVLNKEAVAVMKARADELGLTDLDWKKAENVRKDDHPIVAMYGIVINTELEKIRDGAPDALSKGELRAMLRAGTAAVTEMKTQFISRGAVTLAGEVMPAATAAFMADHNTRSKRNDHVEHLEGALVALKAQIDRM